MAIQYSGVIIGTFTLCQKVRVKEGDKYVDKKDSRGRQVYNRFPIQIRESNCLATFLYVYKEEEPKDPLRPFVHQLVSFIGNEQHLKNCVKSFKSGQVFESIVGGKLQNIKLNMYYDDCKVLLKYMLKDGLKVKCYYKQQRKDK